MGIWSDKPTSVLLFKNCQQTSVECLLCSRLCLIALSSQTPLEERSRYLCTDRTPCLSAWEVLILWWRRNFSKFSFCISTQQVKVNMIQIPSDLKDLLFCFPFNNNDIVTLILVIQSLLKMVLLTKQIREIMPHGALQNSLVKASLCMAKGAK